MILKYLLLVVVMFVVFSTILWMIFNLIGGELGTYLGMTAAAFANLIIMSMSLKWIGRKNE